MRALVVVIALLTEVLLAGLSAHAEVSGREPYEWVRSLRAVQDQIALGSEAAHVYQPKLIAEIAERFASSDAKTLTEPRNVRAAIAYVLSGGEPRVLRALLGFGMLPESDRTLIEGVLAYAEGRYTRAEDRLGDIDARSLDASLGGHVALVQSILVYKTDIKKAISFLDDARLMSTGSLVEEAALRRQTVLVALTGDVDRFVMLASQYFRRFSRSIYAPFFLEQFAAAASNPEIGDERETLEKITTVIDLLPEPDRRAAYVMVAEMATFRGRLALGRLAASNGAALSTPESLDHLRCSLYKASAQVASLEVGEAAATLKNIEGSALAGRDAALLSAALIVAADVEREATAAVETAPDQPSPEDGQEEDAGMEASPPDESQPHGGDRPPNEVQAGPSEDGEVLAATEAAARKALASADELLKGAMR